MVFEELLERLQKQKGPVEPRRTGHVFFSTKYSMGTSPTGQKRLRDWALIELHQGKYQTAFSQLKNTVFVDRDATTLAMQHGFGVNGQQYGLSYPNTRSRVTFHGNCIFWPPSFLLANNAPLLRVQLGIHSWDSRLFD
ncbi:hypothetical protein NM208_g3019 [Fusarium decemcellulare]|uniref:Uncharacterized protein n=1 Tax=Fusarium decemcellulare TaxID=57161 RepID=A0ACC1SQQ3_9HYPO|nr:hypothetical protein NM208_g3019 [Fusarium decemcellulare]